MGAKCYMQAVIHIGPLGMVVVLLRIKSCLGHKGEGLPKICEYKAGLKAVVLFNPVGHG